MVYSGFPPFAQGFDTPSGSINLYMPDAARGVIEDSVPHDFVTPSLINAGGQVASVNTIAIGTPQPGPYSVQVLGPTGSSLGPVVTYTASGADTAATIAAALTLALNQAGLVYGAAIATVSGSNVVITSRKPGLQFAQSVSLSNGGTGYTSTLTTPAANASVLPFGCVVATAQGDNWKTGRLPSSASDQPRGISVRTDAHEITNTGVDGVMPNQMIATLNRGRIYVTPLTSFKPTDTVYYLYSGPNAGSIQNVTAANAQPLLGTKFENAGTAGQFAVLAVNM